ncbi:MAG: hypothetical protein SGBAC_012197, partial [Bacillariaceae sp.]
EEAQVEPVHDIKWERVPATPTQVFQWTRIPSIRVIRGLSKEETEEEPVHDIKWERVPVTPTLDIQWERIASSRVIPSLPKDESPAQEIHWYREPPTTHTVHWERVTAPASPAPKPILKSCLKSALKSSNSKPKSSTKFARVSMEPFSSSDESEEATPKKRGVMIRESINEVNRVSKIRGSAWDNCFFTEDELSDFKYKAFLEECGLTEDDF